MTKQRRYWVPQGKAMDDAKVIMDSHDRWRCDVWNLAKSVGGKCAAIGRGFYGFHLAGIVFDTPPDKSKWKQVKCRDGVAYAPKRVSKKAAASDESRVLDFMDSIKSEPQTLLQKRFAPKEDSFFHHMGAEWVGDSVILIESFGWKMRDCKRISDVEYDDMVEAAKKSKRKPRKASKRKAVTK